MSALNVTQPESELLIASLKMFANVHANASGAVPADVEELLAKLTLAPVVEVTPEPVVEVVVDVPVVEEKPKKSKVSEE
jgi:hypothetical protein